MTNHANYVPNNFVESDPDLRFGGMPQSRLDSENEDLRGVIDDLTIENKRLKHMMRTRSHHRPSIPSEISQQDRLFEVRMHGLPPDKRRELERLLKDFATSVHDKTSVRAVMSLNKSHSKSSSNSMGLMNNKQPPQTDSGYASNSNSNSAPLSSGRIPLSDASPVPVPQKSSSNKAVKSYLQDIPDTLLPKQNPVMSERAKSALVVRRLEQLFTGRNAAPGDHDQPRQQQEISQSAARADRLQDPGNSKKRKAEGPREAHVMPPDTKVNLDAVSYPDPKDSILSPNPRYRDIASNSRLGSPDQRPTRPLDLDVHRAQIATENIQYLRHLGMPFSQPNDPSQNNDENWMYINLLAGLAQLHTLNVTPEFIRRAVKKLSKKFELSKDGHKVRWIGGADETQFTTEDEKAIEVVSMSPNESTEELASGRNSNKRSQTNSTSNPVDTSAPSDGKTSGLQTSSDSKLQQLTTSGVSQVQSSNVTRPTLTSSAFDYKPIVYRGRAFADYAESYLRGSDESFDSQSGDSSGLANAMSKSNLSSKSKEEGALTFYSNPFFFSDFSADREPSNMKRARPAVVGEVLGISTPDEGIESALRYSDATYFTTEFAAKPFQIRTSEDKNKLRFTLPEFEPIHEAGEHESIPLELEVSGLGGVTPEDNFALDVKTTIKPGDTSTERPMQRILPFSGRRYQNAYVCGIQSCERIMLLPSKLPPPSYVFFTSSSSSDDAAILDNEDDEDASDGSSDTSSPLVDETFPAPPAFLQQFSTYSGENAMDDNDDDMGSSDIDMLAIARRVNPEQIAEQERVYAINQPGGPNRAAVAGSLAATVGASRTGSSMHEEAVAADISSNGSEHGSLRDYGMDSD